MAKNRLAFTLVEMLAVLGVISVILVLVVPAVTRMGTPGGTSKAAYDISAALETARAHALANNTYVWVGFYEEDGAVDSKTPAVSGVGRIVIGVVASADGTTVYDPNSAANPDPIDPTRLVQLGKLARVEGAHLASFTDGTGGGNTFSTRPAAGINYARIGGANPPTSTQFPFQLPLNVPAVEAQYIFTKTIQFSPRGEATVNSTYSLRPVVEIGLQQARGNIVDANSTDLVAIQITGVTGNVASYRP